MDLVVISQVCSNVVLCFGTMWRISISLQNPNSVIQGVVKPCELYHVDVFREEVLSVVFLRHAVACRFSFNRWRQSSFPFLHLCSILFLCLIL
jgi:hypothetical protein